MSDDVAPTFAVSQIRRVRRFDRVEDLITRAERGGRSSPEGVGAPPNVLEEEETGPN